MTRGREGIQEEKMKAKLEVEMPEGCYDCQFCAGTECGVAEGMPTIDLFGEEGLRPSGAH